MVRHKKDKTFASKDNYFVLDIKKATPEGKYECMVKVNRFRGAALLLEIRHFTKE